MKRMVKASLDSAHEKLFDVRTTLFDIDDEFDETDDQIREEVQAIADALSITLVSAKALMINELEFNENDFADIADL